MLLKLVSATPLMAMLLSFIPTNIDRLDTLPQVRSLVEFIIIGQIPGTDVFINFEFYLLIFIAFIWLPLLHKASQRAYRIIQYRIDHSAQLSLISL